MIDKNLIERWLTALRSDNYQQAFTSLIQIKDDKKLHCCLGVLCDVAGYNYQNIGLGTGVFVNDKGKRVYASLDNETDLIEKVGLNLKTIRECVTWNDHYKYSFSEIADELDEYYRENNILNG